MAKTKKAVHGENKTERIGTLVTPTGKALLQEKAESLGISVGELLDRFARGQLDEQNEMLGESSAVRSKQPAI